MMIGQKINPWLNAFAGIILFSILFLPDFYLSENLPAFQLLDLILPFLIILILIKRIEIVWRPFYGFLGIFMIYISITMAINSRLGIMRDYFEFYKIFKFFLVVVFFTLIDAVSFLKTYIKPFFILLVIINLVHFYELFNFNYIIENYYHGGLNIKYFGKNTLMEPASKRMLGLMSNPNNNAILFTFFSIYFLPLKFKISKIGWFSVALIMVFLCQSRTSIISIIILALAVFIFKYTNLSIKQGIVFIGICIWGYLLSWMSSSDFFSYDIYSNSMFNGVALESNSVMGRLESWKFLGEMIIQKPIFGHGPNKDFFYDNNIYSENEYVLYTWRYGVIGLIMYLLFYIIPIKSIAIDRKTKYSKYIILISIMMLTTALTNNPLTERTIFILFAICLGVLFQLTDKVNVKKLKQKGLQNRATKKLLLIGSTSNPVHIKNFYYLVKDYFDEVIIVGPHKVDFCTSYVIDFGIKNPFKVRSSIHQLRKLMLDYNPSIVHVHQANSFGYIAALANKRMFPTVLTTWGDDVLILPKKNFIYKKLVTTSLKYADEITADAEIMKTAIHSFYGKVDVEIANFGIDLQNQEIPKKENIIYSNRLHDDLYNIDLIISGSKNFLSQHPDWKLIIAAVGKNTENLKKLVQTLNLEKQVEFVGFLDKEQNLKNYLRSKIYISIPNTDGTSISLLEAMAYGCLPVLSDLPANREWVKDGENGIILNNYQVEQGLERVFTLDAEKAIKMNQEIIDNKATKEVNYSKFIAIYDKLIAN